MGGLLYAAITETIMAFYRASTVEDCETLAPIMRKADAREVYASGGYTPLDALLLSLECATECNTIIHDDKVIGMFGVGDCEESGNGIPWMLASEEINDISFQFLRESRYWIKRVQKNYPLLYNYVAAENTVAVQWLRFLGFKFIREIEDFMDGGLTFYEFVRIQDV